MTEEIIIEILARSVDERKFPYQLPNSFIYSWECDFWTMTQGGETREFEIKISRSDYLCDAKKMKHKDNNGANYFYYVCPEGLIKKDEIDKRYGLIYIKPLNQVEIVKKPRKLNNNVFKDWKMLANKMYWKWYHLWLEKRRSNQIDRKEWLTGMKMEPVNFSTPNN